MIKVGVIGLGNISGVHTSAYLENTDTILVAAADPEQAARDRAKGKFPSVDIYDSYEQMLDSYGLDAVSICVPNHLHAKIAEDCLRRKIHVLCEKPPAMNAFQARAMADAAKENGVILAFDFNNRQRPESIWLKDRQLEGMLGAIQSAKCGWIRHKGIPGYGGWFTQEDLAGGGPIIDLGVHMLDLTLWLMGYPEPAYVLAHESRGLGVNKKCLGPWGTRKLDGVYDVEDSARAIITFKNGQSVILEAAWALRCKAERVYTELYGINAGCCLERTFGADGDDGTSRDIAEIYTTMGDECATIKGHVAPDPSMGRSAMVNHFVDCVLGKAEPVVKPHEAVRLMTILDATYESIREQKPVRFS